jgi:hypothetical protein
MTQDADLKDIERKAYHSYFQDGLWDGFLGLLMLGMGLFMLMDQILWYVIILPVAVLLPTVGRKLITVPRLGRVRYGPARKVKVWKTVAVLSASVLVGIAFFVLRRTGVDLPGWAFAILVGVWLATVFGFVAYYMDLRRLYAYGALFSASFVVALLPLYPAGVFIFLVSGGLACVTGGVMLVRFLRRYPKPGDGGPDGVR